MNLYTDIVQESLIKPVYGALGMTLSRWYWMRAFTFHGIDILRSRTL